MAAGRGSARARCLVGCPSEPRAFPLLDLLRQPLKTRSHQKQSLAYIRISRLSRKLPQCCGLAQILPRNA